MSESRSTRRSRSDVDGSSSSSSGSLMAVTMDESAKQKAAKKAFASQDAASSMRIHDAAAGVAKERHRKCALQRHPLTSCLLTLMIPIHSEWLRGDWFAPRLELRPPFACPGSHHSRLSSLLPAFAFTQISSLQSSALSHLTASTPSERAPRLSISITASTSSDRPFFKHSSFIRGGDYLKSMIYGGLDGIITTFAVRALSLSLSCFFSLLIYYQVVAGAAGGNLGAAVVLVMGFSNLIADGTTHNFSHHRSH